jgi:MFS family permease
VGPVLGGYLTEWTWRAIFWVNIPVAVIALVLIYISKPETLHKPAPVDYRGLVLIALGIALSIFGFQQSNIWGWSNPGIGISIALGLVLLVAFGFTEARTDSPLIKIDIFRIRAFLVENLVLGISMLAFIPVFFFGSEYAQISLGKPASQAGIILLYFFIGFVVAAQIGGRLLDRRGAKRPVLFGCAIAAVGFYLWGQKVTQLSFSDQEWYIIIAGFGMGMMLGPASTDAVNRASDLSYGEATGITQTVRNYAASLGLAVLGTILVTRFRAEITSSLVAMGTPHDAAAHTAASISQSQDGSKSVSSIPHFIRLDFAHATQTVFYVMAGVMAAATAVALFGLERGLQSEASEEAVYETSQDAELGG